MSEFDAQPGPISLSADQQAVALREISDLMHGLSLVSGELSNSRPLERELTRNILYIAEASLANLSRITGIDTESASRREERYGELRRAHQRLRELEALLGQGHSPEHTQQSVRGLMERLRHWWRSDGLGHINEASLDGYGQVEAKLSCHLFGNFRATASATPVSDKSRKAQWLDALRARGFVLGDDQDDRESVVDCDASRQALCQLITSALPSAQVFSISNQGSSNGALLLVDVHVFVRKLSDLAALPEPVRN
jgi:hypothetical protein